jgi:hypothetical protein
VPFSVNIYGRDGATVVEYFQPSSFLALVGNDAAINGISQRLDELMSELVHELGVVTGDRGLDMNNS